MAVTDVLRPIYDREVGAAQIDLIAQDNFDRFETNGWGLASTGQVWSVSGGAASDYSVEGG